MERDHAGLVEEGGKEPTFRSFRSGFSLMDAHVRKGCAGTGSLLFNVLLLLCFFMCIILFSVTLIKYSELAAEMKRGQPSTLNYSELAAEMKRGQPSTLNYSELAAEMKRGQPSTLNYSELAAEMKRGQPSTLNLTQTLAAMSKSAVELANFMAFMCKLCPFGWLRYNNTCYLFSGSAVGHRLAREACTSQDSYLLIIEDQQELNFLVQNTKSKGHWMDLSDSGSEGQWHWGDGKPLTYSNWNTGEPNNDKNNEDCAELLSNGFWNDIPCSHSFNYICKKQGSC